MISEFYKDHYFQRKIKKETFGPKNFHQLWRSTAAEQIRPNLVGIALHTWEQHYFRDDEHIFSSLYVIYDIIHIHIYYIPVIPWRVFDWNRFILCYGLKLVITDRKWIMRKRVSGSRPKGLGHKNLWITQIAFKQLELLSNNLNCFWMT